MSYDTINQLLRTNLGFDGVVISDDPSMKAISDHYDLKKTILNMINAGVDLFILGNNLNYDPDLIGGLIMQVESVMIDTSIKNKLQQIENKMIEA